MSTHLDEDSEFVLAIDDRRSVSITPSADHATFVLATEDVQTVAIVEMTRAEAVELKDGLARLLGDGGEML